MKWSKVLTGMMPWLDQVFSSSAQVVSRGREQVEDDQRLERHAMSKSDENLVKVKTVWALTAD